MAAYNLLPEDPMKTTVILATLGAAFFSGSGTMVVPFLSLYLLELGCTEDNVKIWTSIAFSCSFLVGAVMLPCWGALSDRLGRKKMLLRSSGGMSLVFLLGSMVVSPLQLVGMRLLQGFCFGFVSVAQALVSDVSGRKTGQMIGFLMGGRSAGLVMGPFLGGILAHLLGIRMSFVTASCATFVLTVLVFFLIKDPEKPAGSARHGFRESLRLLSHNRTFMHLTLMMVANQTALFTINPLLALHIGKLAGDMDKAAILSGIIIGMSGIAGMLMSPVWGWIGQKKGFFRALITCFLGDAFFTLCQFFAPNVLTFGILQFCYGLFIIGGAVSITGAIAEYTDESLRGSAYGLNSTALNIGNFTGPLVGGLVSSLFGTSAIFLAASAIQLAAGSFVYFKLEKKKN